MSRYVMVSLIPCQSPNVRPIVVMPGGTRYTLARYGKEFDASSWSEMAAYVASVAADEEIPSERECDTGAVDGYAVVETTEHHYTLDLDTGEVRKWRVRAMFEASDGGKMQVHR